MYVGQDLYARRMALKLRQLRALVAVADEGTFTDAAILLGCSQATVSRSVATLEQVVGSRLLARNTRRVDLTAEGSQVVALARRVLGLVDSIEQVGQDTVVELKVGYAWSELGVHTVRVQRHWAALHPESPLVFVQTSSPTGGLAEGVVDVAVLRRPVTHAGLATAEVGTEVRLAAVAANDQLADRGSVTLADFSGRTVAVDPRTGTTSEDLWPPGAGPRFNRQVVGLDDWLTSIAAGQSIGITSAATAYQHPRPGVVYRPVEDAPPVRVSLAWWRDSPPRNVDALVRVVRESYQA
jgi:DNA-binding transcriptional LysR family regulator